MTRHGIGFTAAAISLLFALPAFGQGGPGTGTQPGSVGMPSAGTRDMGRSEVQDESDRIYREQLLHRRVAQDSKQSRATTMQESSDAAKALQLSCDVKDAGFIGQAHATVNGRSVNAKTYEIACGNGMGYFVVWQDPELPVAYSCLQAEGQRAAAAAKGQQYDGVCELPANRDLNAMATRLLASGGATCGVTKLAWFGKDEKGGAEFTEVVCSDGKGYVLATSLPGFIWKAQAQTCSEAAARGMACQMTTVAVATAGPATAAADDDHPTAEALKAALAQHGVACTVADLRLIGREKMRRRHVVEFQCPEQPKGLVAFIPLGANVAKFETLDCVASTKAGIACKLTH